MNTAQGMTYEQWVNKHRKSSNRNYGRQIKGHLKSAIKLQTFIDTQSLLGSPWDTDKINDAIETVIEVLSKEDANWNN